MIKFLTTVACLLVTAAIAQPKTPTGVNMSLELQSTEGTNGCAVAWNPKLKLYYTIIAGNVSFPIDVFDERGTWKKSTKTGVDNRGMWFNTKSGKLNGRAYNGQLVEWDMNNAGIPDNTSVVVETGEDGQNIATSGKGVIYQYQNGAIAKFSAKGKKTGTINLPTDFNAEEHNAYSMGFTGVKRYEFVLLNLGSTSLEFFDLKGKRTATIALPGDVPYAESFRFSFANNHAWLYDADKRVWLGYKVF
jgi:hypothetical protein